MTDPSSPAFERGSSNDVMNRVIRELDLEESRLEIRAPALSAAPNIGTVSTLVSNRQS
jgi:hypothetical protein